jgi:hypothetical protein
MILYLLFAGVVTVCMYLATLEGTALSNAIFE